MPCRPGRQTPAVIPAREKASLRDLENGEEREPQMNADVDARHGGHREEWNRR